MSIIRLIKLIFKNYLHPQSNSILIVFLIALILNIVTGSLFYYFESSVQDITYIDSIWWSMVTMTTVGYGDFFPKTIIGRFLITYPTMVIGIGLIGYLIGVVAESIIDFAARKRKGLMEITFSDHIIICNYPSEEKVLNLIKELKFVPELKNKRIVLITEVIDQLPESFKNDKIRFIKGVPTDEVTLLKANILNCNGVIILSESNNYIADDRSYTIGSLIEIMEKNFKTPIKTITEIIRERNKPLIEKAEVDGIVSTEGISGQLIVQEFVNPGINGVLKQLMTNSIGSQLYLYETDLGGYKITDLQLKAIKYDKDIQIIGVSREGKDILNPKKGFILQEKDKLIIIAESRKDIVDLEKLFDTTS